MTKRSSGFRKREMKRRLEALELTGKKTGKNTGRKKGDEEE